MPTYEYACTSCGNEWEFEQSMKDDPLKECPKCKQQTAKRQISRGTGFILKGGGWYSDLYSGSSNKSGSGGGGSGSGTSAGGTTAPTAAPATSTASSDSGGSSGGSTSGGSTGGTGTPAAS